MHARTTAPEIRVACGGPDGGILELGPDGITRILAHPQTHAVLTRDHTTYAVSGITDGELIALSPSGETSRWTIGAIPCHLAIAPDGRSVVIANYGSASLSLAARHPDGTLDEPRTIALDGDGSRGDPERQTRPRPHHALWVGDHLLVTDLGSDVIRVFTAGPAIGLVERVRCATPPGSGPRHAVVVPDRESGIELLVVTAELSAELLVAPLADVLAGTAAWATAPTGSPGGERRYPSDVTPWGPGVAVGNRGTGTIGVLTLEAGIPRLRTEHDAGGRWPQHLHAEASGGLLIAQPEDHAIVRLHPDGRVEIVATLPAPGWLESP